MATERKSQALSQSIVAGLVNSAGRPYKWLPAEVEQAELRSSAECSIVRQVFRDMLEQFEAARCPLQLPASVTVLYERELKRLWNLTQKADDDEMRFSLDTRRKDLAILSFRLIPIGAEFAEPAANIWFRKVLTGGVLQFFRAIRFFTGHARPFGPWFQLHMHPQSKDDFSEDGWMASYVRLGELLRLNPQYCGWYSASWFVDPALASVSPHLSYLWEVPRENGGEVFFLWKDVAGESGALATSRTRRRSHSEGTYVPKVYLRVWPRDAAIAWSARQRGAGQ